MQQKDCTCPRSWECCKCKATALLSLVILRHPGFGGHWNNQTKWMPLLFGTALLSSDRDHWTARWNRCQFWVSSESVHSQSLGVLAVEPHPDLDGDEPTTGARQRVWTWWKSIRPKHPQLSKLDVVWKSLSSQGHKQLAQPTWEHEHAVGSPGKACKAVSDSSETPWLVSEMVGSARQFLI